MEPIIRQLVDVVKLLGMAKKMTHKKSKVINHMTGFLAGLAVVATVGTVAIVAVVFGA